MLTDIRCRSPSGINYCIIIASYFDVLHILGNCSIFVKGFTTTKYMDLASLLSASGWSYKNSEYWLYNPNWPCCQVLKLGRSNLCPATSHEGLPGYNKLLILNGNDLNPEVISWAPWGINKTHTIVHICPVQLLERSLGAYPKGSKGFLGESVSVIPLELKCCC